jgi:hypothetical protein
MKLISRQELNPDAVLKRLSDEEYNLLISDINEYLLDNKEQGSAKIVFRNENSVVKNFGDCYSRIFFDEQIWETAVKKFKKELKKSDFDVTTYNTSYGSYFYCTFEISWK